MEQEKKSINIQEDLKNFKQLDKKKQVIYIVIVIILIWIVFSFFSGGSGSHSNEEIIEAAKSIALKNSVITTNDLQWKVTKVIEKDKYERCIVLLEYSYGNSSDTQKLLVNISGADEFYRYRIKKVTDGNMSQIITELKKEAHWGKSIEKGL